MVYKPLVSVVMSVYNDEQYLRQAIESILNQTFKNFEFIIIDDGSTDNSWKIIDHYAKQDRRIKVIHQKNHGLIYSLNKGLRLAKGTYIARQDGDDISENKRLKLQLDYFKINHNVAILFGWHKVIDGTGDLISKIEYSCNDRKIKKNILKGRNIYAHGSVMFKKEIILSLGGYSTMALHFEDSDLWIRLIKNNYNFSAVKKIIYRWRVNLSSITFKEKNISIFHFLQNLYFREQNRKKIFKNTVSLIKNKDIKCKEFLKCLSALQPLNYKWIFKYL